MNQLIDEFFSFVLVIEEVIEGLTLQCPVHTTTNNAKLGYTLKKGTHPQLTWTNEENGTVLATGR